LGGFRAFVVDSNLPLVAFRQSPAKDTCYVTARSRSGQTARTERFIASRFPNAVEIDPKTLDVPAEQAWQIEATPDVILYTMRDGSAYGTPHYTLGLTRL